MITTQLQALNQQIRKLEQEYHREPSSVKLVAVSKTKPTESMVEAFEAGQLAFGENYLQEALTKINALKAYPIEWHFIGSVQSNKTKQIAEHFSWVHGVCSLEHAKRLGAARPANLGLLNVCIQVNISEENSKSGIHLDQLEKLVSEANVIKGIHLRGLMVIPQAGLSSNEQRQNFHRLKVALEELNKKGFTLDSLSMGMSDDFAAAIAEGATIIRLGTAIFGKRE